MDNVIEFNPVRLEVEERLNHLGECHFYRDQDGIMVIEWKSEHTPVGTEGSDEFIAKTLQEGAWVGSTDLAAMIFLEKGGNTSVRCLEDFGRRDYWWIVKNVLNLFHSIMPGAGDY